MTKPEIIGKKIKRLRQALDLTQREFARKINTSGGQVHTWEKGENYISIKYLLKIHEAFNINLEAFNTKPSGELDKRLLLLLTL
jgi:transcriptional regulator with XRE-family HTH domain